MKKIFNKITFIGMLCLSVATFGQSLAVTQAGPTPAYVVAATSGIAVTVFNAGGIAATGATVSSAIPGGMNYKGFNGTNWNCTPTSANDPVGTITCTYSASIPVASAASPLTINLQPRRAVMGTSPSVGISVDPTGGAAPPAPGTCTGVNTPNAGCGTPLSSAVPAAQSNVHMGPRGNPGNTSLNNIVTNREHYDATTWPQPDFATLTGNIVVVSPKTIRNTGNIPWSFGLVQGNKAVNYAQNPGFFDFTGAAAGVFFDNAPDITSEVSFDNGVTWVQLKSAAGLSSNTTFLTRAIHTIDSANVPFGGYVLQPGQSLDFLVRHTWPNARYTGRTDLTINIYVGLYMPGSQNSLSLEGFTNITSARNWVGPNGETGAWSSVAPTNEIFESTLDTIITGSVDIQKAQTISNSSGIGAATDVVKGAEITYTLTITGKIPNTTNTTTLTSGPFLQPFRLPAQSNSVRVVEDGNAAPNNWATWTDAVPGSATCSVPATITGDTTGSSAYTFNLTDPITAGDVVTCSFKRKVK